MSFIESSTRPSPLAQASNFAPDPDQDAPMQTGEDGADEEAPGQDEEEKLPTLAQDLIDKIDEINLARDIDQQVLDEIGMTVIREYEIDENSRAAWRDKADEAMKFALQLTTEKQYPWPKASNVIFPLITSAALQFAARMYPAIVQGRNVVKGSVWGADRGTPATMDGKPDGKPKTNADGSPVWIIAPGEKRARADRIGEHMSFQLLDKMPEWEPQTDSMLHQIPIVGGAARKTFHDPSEGRNFSLFVSLIELVWNYGAPSFEAAQRLSEKVEVYPHEIESYERTDRASPEDEGMWLHLDYGPAGGLDGEQVRFAQDEGDNDSIGSSQDPDAPHLFIEQDRRWDLDGDGYAEPITVTVHHRSQKVVRIVARWDKEGIETNDADEVVRVTPVQRYTLYRFFPSIDGGSYPIGFGHLIKQLNEAINTTLNQMFDAGHLANAGGGFVGDQLGVASGQINFQVGKFVRVNTKGQDIRQSVFPIPFQGPNSTLFQLLGTLIGAGKEIASIQEILSGDAAIANAPPTTVLALIEQGLKVYTAITKRLYNSMKAEFDKLYRLNRIYIDKPEKYKVGDEEREIHPDDYRMGGGVEPVADPTQVTDMQRLVRSQVIKGYLGNPIMRQDEIIRRELEAANIERIDDLFAPPDPNAQAMAQLAMAQAQAELGKTRASEQKDTTQAFLNLALARKNATAQEETMLQMQMDFLRFHIEAINAATRAAAVDHKFHDSEMRDASRRAQDLAREQPGAPGAVQLQPDAQGPFPQANVQPPAGSDVVNAGSKGAGTPPAPDPGAPAMPAPVVGQ